MNDPRDFDMARIPGIEAALATGVPESCSPLVEAVEALERERDELREQVERLQGECGDAMLEGLRLRAALEKYGRHSKDCLLIRDLTYKDARCDCGLAEALHSPGQSSARSTST